MQVHAKINNCIDTDNWVAEQLAKDRDYQNFVLGSFEVLQKVKQTNSSALFFKRVNNTASQEEKTQLALNLGFKDYKSFSNHLSKIFENKISYFAKFPNLEKDENVLQTYKLAVAKVFKDNRKELHTPSDCWYYWLSLMSLCSSMCLNAPNYDECWMACQLAASDQAALCFAFAD